jgi:hypothetical protein
MRTCGKILLLVSLLTCSTLAQNAMQSPVPAAGSGPAFDLSAGATYLVMSSPTTGSASLYGADAAGTMDFSRFWGATLDSSYVRTSDVFNLGHSGNVLTFLAGPVFHPFETRETRISIRALVGAGLVDSAVPADDGNEVRGWVARPAYAVGVGAEHSFAGPFALRMDADYLRTAFAESTAVVEAQNNLRLTLSLVFHIRDRQF